MRIEISAISVYPVKSCRPLHLENAQVERRGLRHDRRWMVVDPNGVFMTRREIPEMAKIGATPGENVFTLTKEGLQPITIPLNPQGPSKKVTVWRSITTARYVSPEADRWLTQALGRECRLVYMPETARRKINPLFNLGNEVVGFADGYPILVASQASIDDLNGRLTVPIPIQRFRPNLVLKGPKPYEEDTWERIQIGDTVLRSTKPCIRCLVTTQDANSGDPTGPEPLKTLATYRRVEGGVIFGMYYVPEKLGRIALGDVAVAL